MLSREEKIAAMHGAIEILRQDFCIHGLCFCLDKWVWIHKGLDIGYRELMEDYFPEVLQLKPQFICANGYWFPIGEKEPRIEVLKKAIELVKQQI